MQQSVLEVDLGAIRHNLDVYREFLKPGTEVMCMVKASSYGSGSVEVCKMLETAGVQYLGVAYCSEAVLLRKAGNRLRIMVMVTEIASFEDIVANCLEPEIYSFKILNAFNSFLKEKDIKDYPVHIKIETGMNRLGFQPADVDELCRVLKELTTIKVQGVMSHLAASGMVSEDEFTMQQATVFGEAASKIEVALGYRFIRHINNSYAIHRHPSLQMDMVRLGIGMYGADSDIQHRLKNVSTLKTTIAQIRQIKKGETVGYSRSHVASQETTMAVVRIGYADGYPRLLSNGRGYMLVNGKKAPVLGRVCMDMTMLDITGIAAKEDDEVIVFGKELSASLLAEWAQTIEYEIFTNISQRVKREYVNL